MRLISMILLMAAVMAQGGTAFWVWNRNYPLAETELADLRDAGVTDLYWHFGEIVNRDGDWKWRKLPEPLPAKSTPALRIVPVIRLESSVAEPFGEDQRKKLIGLIGGAMASTGADEWQIDYDSPDRLLGDYAGFLAELGEIAPELSATALAGWVRLPEFGRFCGSVKSLCPMFYDLEPDTADVLRPMMDADGTLALAREWETKCDVPWRAGLPWFGRLTIYGGNGQSRGHLRHWSWDDVIFRRELSVQPEKAPGITVFRAVKPLAIGKSVLREGELLVVKRPDATALSRVEKALGRDEIFFRLPDAADSAGGSLREFAKRGQAASPSLAMTRQGDKLVLKNVGPRDLPPRACEDGANDRGYAVEVEGVGMVFREALPGGFFRVSGHRDPDSGNPVPARVSAATRLTFWFSSLPAGTKLDSGLFQLAPAAADLPLKYRILNLTPDLSWKPLEVVR